MNTTSDPTSAPAGAQDTPAGGAKLGAVVGLLVFFELTSGILQGSVLPLIPGIRDDLSISTGNALWITATQFLFAAVCVPVFGRLGDLYGHRRMLRISLVSIAVGCVLCALAPNLTVFLLGRALLGPLAALLPLEIGLVRDRLGVAEGRRAVSWLVGALTLGSVLGTAATGPLHSALGGDVRSTLWVLAVIAVGCALLSFFPRIPETRVLAPGRMDWTGSALLGLGLVSLLGICSQGNSLGWNSPVVLGGLVLAVTMLTAWVRVSLRNPNALVDVRAMANRAVAPHYVSGFVLGATLLGGQAVAVAFLDARPEAAGYGFGLAAWEISLWMAVPMVLAFATASTSSSVARIMGYRNMLVLAFSLIAGGFGIQIAGTGTVGLWATGYAVAGAGFGLALGGLPTVIVEASARDRAASATAIYNNLKTVGGSVAGAASATLFATFLVAGTQIPALTSYLIIWGFCAALGLVSVVLTRRSNTGR
ncbi:MFS transporter [Streptomyces sp. BI20]|uniref:MFS transporter n=1 Tax=Streptomyces sp. BI20 TaxID=3403460 RepID=UPI003C72509C